MSSLAHYLVFILLALAGGALLSDPRFGENASVPGFTEGVGECRPTGPELMAGRGSVEDSQVAFYKNGYLRMLICGRGTLHLIARGTPSAGAAAHMLVALGADPLWEGPVTTPKALSLDLDRPGWLTIAFLNDASTGNEDRNLWLSELRFEPSP